MTKKVVDTNVAIAANGRDTHACLVCQKHCIQVLLDITQGQSILVLDSKNLILDEYSTYLSYSGQPGVGDIFFKYIYDNQFSNTNINHVTITPTNNQYGFSELTAVFPDPSDRKFLATAKVSNSIILNALDTDWSENSAVVTSQNVSILELCPMHIQ